MLKKYDPDKIGTISHSLKALNTQYGRTKEDLMKKATALHERFKANLSLEECFECVRFRIICETWNGIIIREKHTIEILKKMFPQIVFSKVEGEKDYAYGVDYELFLNNELLGAIQIKPQSYLRNTPHTRKAQGANRRKFEAYKNKFGRNVRVVVSDMKGTILNRDDFLKFLERYYKNHT